MVESELSKVSILVPILWNVIKVEIILEQREVAFLSPSKI